VLAYLPIVQRTDAHSIRYTGQSVFEVVRFLEFVDKYEPGLTP
jgi:D-aminopeptidase